MDAAYRRAACPTQVPLQPAIGQRAKHGKEAEKCTKKRLQSLRHAADQPLPLVANGNRVGLELPLFAGRVVGGKVIRKLLQVVQHQSIRIRLRRARALPQYPRRVDRGEPARAVFQGMPLATVAA